MGLGFCNGCVRMTVVQLFLILLLAISYSRGTKVEKMLTLAPERYTVAFSMVAKVILWCI